MTYIRTRNVEKFYLLESGVDDIVLDDIAHSLSSITRFTGHTKSPYTVAQHSMWCADSARERGLSLQVQRWCLMHDASEAYVGDLTSPIKALCPEFRAIENRIIDLIRKRFHLGTCPAVVFEIDHKALDWEFSQVFEMETRVPHHKTIKADFIDYCRKLDIR